jgi:DNA repair protein RadA/Sms
MVKVRTVFRCHECGVAAPQWAGRCHGCGSWNTLVEEAERPPGAAGARPIPLTPAAPPVPIAEVDTDEWAANPTGIGEVDRVLGGGLVPGSVTLIGGEPGIGKSTLLLQMIAGLAARGSRALIVSAEESRPQVRMRAERLDAIRAGIWLAAETAMPAIAAFVDDVRPDVLVVDSIQTVFDPELGSAAGSVGQVRECAAALVRLAKERGVTVVLVGHVTKDGALAGPRVLEHLVDTVLSFEGDSHHALRLLRAVKHRFGATGELGLFEMGEEGLREVADPSALLLGDRRAGSTGSVVAPTIDGNRPLLVELQALIGAEMDNHPNPRRSVQGLDAARVALLLAVLDRRCGVKVAKHEVYASAVGGVRVIEPGADLALAVAIASSSRGVPAPADLVACAEVGLGGELRQVAQTPRRLAEAARLGFTCAIVPASAPAGPSGLRLARVSTLAEALGVAGVLS